MIRSPLGLYAKETTKLYSKECLTTRQMINSSFYYYLPPNNGYRNINY